MGEAERLVDAVLWAFRAYRGHGFRLTYWPAQLGTWLTVLGDRLPTDACRETRRVYDWMLVHQPAFAALTDDAVEAAEEDRSASRRDWRAA